MNFALKVPRKTCKAPNSRLGAFCALRGTIRSTLLRMGRILKVLIAATALVIACAAPADADDFSGCESWAFYGIDPHIRKICDDPIKPDGTWLRWRQVIRLDKVRSTCSGVFDVGGQCPLGTTRDVIPGSVQADMYYLTVDTIPPGEPGHLDNPNRCGIQGYRCDVP